MNINSNSPKKMISFKSVDKLRSSSKHSGKSSAKKKNREVSNDYEDEGRLNQTTKLARSSLRATSPEFNATVKTPKLRSPKKDSLTPLTHVSKHGRKESSRRGTGRKSSKKDKSENGGFGFKKQNSSPTKGVSNMQAQITDLENQGLNKGKGARNSPGKKNEQQKSMESLGVRLEGINDEIDAIKEKCRQLDK